MNIEINTTRGPMTVSIKRFIERELDGADYGLGRIEELAATQRKQNEFLGNLTEVLIQKNIITEDNLKDWFYEFTGFTTNQLPQ